MSEVNTIAFGKVFFESLVSSANELNASKPVNEKHKSVAPAINALISVPLVQNGSNVQS